VPASEVEDVYMGLPIIGRDNCDPGEWRCAGRPFLSSRRDYDKRLCGSGLMPRERGAGGDCWVGASLYRSWRESMSRAPFAVPKSYRLSRPVIDKV